MDCQAVRRGRHPAKDGSLLGGCDLTPAHILCAAKKPRSPRFPALLPRLFRCQHNSKARHAHLLRRGYLGSFNYSFEHLPQISSVALRGVFAIAAPICRVLAKNIVLVRQVQREPRACLPPKVNQLVVSDHQHNLFSQFKHQQPQRNRRLSLQQAHRSRPTR